MEDRILNKIFLLNLNRSNKIHTFEGEKKLSQSILKSGIILALLKENKYRMYKNEKATQFHSTITLIQGCLIKNTSWGDEDVIVEERSRNYRSEWIGLQERTEKRMETN